MDDNGRHGKDGPQRRHGSYAEAIRGRVADRQQPQSTRSHKNSPGLLNPSKASDSTKRDIPPVSRRVPSSTSSHLDNSASAKESASSQPTSSLRQRSISPATTGGMSSQLIAAKPTYANVVKGNLKALAVKVPQNVKLPDNASLDVSLSETPSSMVPTATETGAAVAQWLLEAKDLDIAVDTVVGRSEESGPASVEATTGSLSTARGEVSTTNGETIDPAPLVVDRAADKPLGMQQPKKRKGKGKKTWSTTPKKQPYRSERSEQSRSDAASSKQGSRKTSPVKTPSRLSAQAEGWANSARNSAPRAHVGRFSSVQQANLGDDDELGADTFRPQFDQVQGANVYGGQQSVPAQNNYYQITPVYTFRSLVPAGISQAVHPNDIFSADQLAARYTGDHVEKCTFDQGDINALVFHPPHFLCRIH